MPAAIKTENLSKLYYFGGAKHSSLRDMVIFRRMLGRKAHFL